MDAFDRLEPYLGRIFDLWKYYGAALINTAFGYGLYSLLIFIGLNIFVAQIIAHVCGTIFNYFTYSRIAFSNTKRSVPAYIGAYTFNYLLGLGALAVAHQLIPSPYIAGFVSMVAVSLVNYLVLRRFVFKRIAKIEAP